MVSIIKKIIVPFVFNIIIGFAIYYITSFFFKNVRTNLNWGITLQFAFILYGCLSLVLALLFHKIKKNKTLYWIYIIAYLMFCIVYINNIAISPYKLILLYLSVGIGWIIPILIWKKNAHTPNILYK